MRVVREWGISEWNYLTNLSNIVRCILRQNIYLQHSKKINNVILYLTNS